MTLLVTGGSGFIGSHLCEKLIRRREHVICVDNFITGTDENVAGLVGQANFTLVEHDVRRPLALDREVDQIYHLASPASPVDYRNLPLETLLVNSQGTWNLLELARETGAKLLLTSTSEIYGDPQVSPQTEDYWGNVNPVGPRSCYDEGKRFAEALVSSYTKIHGLRTTTIRVFNTFGPRMRRNDGRVVPNLINQALANEPLTIYGDGTQTRSFCYVDDLVDGLVRAMESEKADGEIINMGNPREMTISSLADLIKQLTGATSDLVYRDLPPDDPMRRRPDISKAKNLLGWEPKVSLEDGLKQVIGWFQHARAS